MLRVVLQAQPYYEIDDADTDHENDELLSPVGDNHQNSMQHDSSAGVRNIEQGTSSTIQQQQPQSVGPVLETSTGSRRATRSSSRK